MKKSILPVLLAEFLGTFTLCFVVILSISGTYPVPTPVLAGLVLGLFVYSIGNISGCHINPGVTLGLLSIRKIQGSLAAKYIAAQLLAAMLALLLADLIGINLGLIPPTPNVAYLFEFFGMMLFTFGIASVVFDSNKTIVSGLVVGGSLLLGISFSVLGGALGILNPAVALSLSVTDIGYYLVEIIGGVAGFRLYSFIQSRKI